MPSARSNSGNWTPLLPILWALMLLGAATASGPMPRRAMSTLQMCNPELATAPSALDAFAARMLDFFALSERAIVLPDPVTAAPKRPNAEAAASRAPPALDSLAPHILARIEHRIEAQHELGAAVAAAAATESRVRAHLQAESRVGPSTGAKKKCPPLTLEDYRVWIPPLADHIVALGYLFTVIALVIFIPQLISIIRRNSTIGVSLTTMVFSIISGANQFWNVYLLDYWQVRACYEVGAAECMPHIQPIAQAAAGYLAMLPLFITALVIFVREDATDQVRRSFASAVQHTARACRPVIPFELFLFAFALAFVLSLAPRSAIPNTTMSCGFGACRVARRSS
jgi:uncharacterized protein with PQ loop repeat